MMSWPFGTISVRLGRAPNVVPGMQVLNKGLYLLFYSQLKHHFCHSDQVKFPGHMLRELLQFLVVPHL